MTPNGPEEKEPTLHDVVGILNVMNGRMDTIDERLGGIEHRLGSVEGTLGDVQETVYAIAQAVDKDSVTLINHGRRIAKLEQA